MISLEADPEDYERLVAGLATEVAQGHRFTMWDAIEARVRACLDCHGIRPRIEVEPPMTIEEAVRHRSHLP